MKRLLTIIFLLASALLVCRAQDAVPERVYISTDRDVYVAGDDMFVSAFCLNTAAGCLSDLSRVAYLEIISADGPVQTGKIALLNGRGGGMLKIQNTIPTGNYKIVAYTSQCFNEEGYDFEEGFRTISIINPFTTDRSGSGVEILDADAYASLSSAALPAAGSLRAEMADGRLTLTNMSSEPVSLSVSLFNDDGIVSPNSSNPVTFRDGATCGTAFSDIRTPDYEGEIVRTRVRGTEDFSTIAGNNAFLSIPGRVSDMYSTKVTDSGEAVFYTRNIFGDEEAFIEISSPGIDCHLDIESPFRSVKATGLEAMPLSASLEQRILDRSVAMQVRKAAGADSLYERLDIPEDPFLDADRIEYILDDYTRFPLMEELFIEFIHQIRVLKSGKVRNLVVFVQDSHRPSALSNIPALVLLDGVPVLDHAKIFDYDPLLVEKVIIYPHYYNLGPWSYSGIINFVTYKRNMPSYSFGDNVRVVNWQGESFPVAAYLPDGSKDHPDLRQTILWHPLVDIGPGESRVLHYALPSYDGRFILEVEGFDAKGAPQYLSLPLN